MKNDTRTKVGIQNSNDLYMVHIMRDGLSDLGNTLQWEKPSVLVLGVAKGASHCSGWDHDWKFTIWNEMNYLPQIESGTIYNVEFLATHEMYYASSKERFLLSKRESAFSWDQSSRKIWENVREKGDVSLDLI